MTREEAKDKITELAKENFWGCGEWLEALEIAIKALEQEPEPVYFPPCVDCQDRSKEILTAYNNMKKMQTYTKEEVITMLDKIRAEILENCFSDVRGILNKYKADMRDKG